MAATKLATRMLLSSGATVRALAKKPSATMTVLARTFAEGGDGGDILRTGGGRRRGRRTAASPPAPAGRGPPPPAPAADPWVAVKDPQSGSTYWWNQQTDEVTAVGEPKPGGELQQQEPAQGGSMMGRMGGVVAEGFAFGVGSSIARSMVGSFLGDSDMFSGGGDDGGGGGDYDDDDDEEDDEEEDGWGDDGSWGGDGGNDEWNGSDE